MPIAIWAVLIGIGLSAVGFLLRFVLNSIIKRIEKLESEVEDAKHIQDKLDDIKKMLDDE